MRPIELEIVYDTTAAVASIATAQLVTAQGAFTLATAWDTVLDDPQRLTFHSTAGYSAVTISIVGVSPEGWPQSESIAGPSAGGTAVSLYSYGDTALAITIGTAAGTAVMTIGNASYGAGPWIPLDIYVPNSRTTISTDVGTAATAYSWQFTNSNIWGENGVPPDPDTILAFDHPVTALVNAATDQYGSTEVLMRAVRIVTSAPAGGTIRSVVTQQSTI